MNILNRFLLIFAVGTFLILPSCASVPKTPPPAGHRAYIAEDEDALSGRYAPVFLIENDREAYNLIGKVRARLDDDGREDIFVDPESPAIYYQERTFETKSDSYTNLIYRVHFREVPLSLFPFYLGKGKNVGLFVVVTLNSRNEPVLYTTVHTCGCYLAFMPTSLMPEEAFPAGWNREGQRVLGEKLPGLLSLAPGPDLPLKPVILIRSGSHRVKDAWMAGTESLGIYRTVSSPLLPLGELDNLPLGGGKRTSFFETSGPRKGYVKGSQKVWERFLMSWWAFDWRIGEDKKLGLDKNDGPIFYTSLKFWDRKRSDMRDFAAFLEYWGWKL